MKKIFVLVVLSLVSLCGFAQTEIKIKMMEQLPNDLAARTHARQDNNGDDCALVRVVVPAVKGIQFKGWVIGEVGYQPGEYQVYVPQGTKKITFMHENYEPGEIRFSFPIESKCVYRVVLEVPDLGTKYVTECSAMMTEASRLYGLRDYEAAKASYQSALNTKDVPADLIPALRSNIAQCDSCVQYEMYAKGSLAKIKQMRTDGKASQAEVVRYASAAIEFLSTLNNYNPNDFYTERIATLEKFVENMPLEIRFTFTKWEKDYEGFKESGFLSGVEIWAYSGDEEPALKNYQNTKYFKKMVSASPALFKKLDTTTDNGIYDAKFDRKELPTGLFFHMIGPFEDKIQTEYIETKDLLTQSKGDYTKRQFHLKMYTSK